MKNCFIRHIKKFDDVKLDKFIENMQQQIDDNMYRLKYERLNKIDQKCISDYIVFCNDILKLYKDEKEFRLNKDKEIENWSNS